MIKVFFISILLFVGLSIFLSGCGEEKKQSAQILNLNSGDTSSVIINYDVTGAGSGKIILSKKNNKVKLELERPVNGQNNIESRFISDGWIYFYFTTATTVQPVKSRIIKDHNYFKNFAVLADADEIVAKLKKNGNEIVAGFTCDDYENNLGAVYSVYAGKYVFKASFDGIIITATKVSLNLPLKNEDVEKPAGIDFLELTAEPK